MKNSIQLHSRSRKTSSHKSSKTKKLKNSSSWPYYSTFISKNRLKTMVAKMLELDFKVDNTPYSPILFTRKTPVVPIKYKGQYTRFIDNNYLEYDVLPLVYSEKELLKCQFRDYRPAIKNYILHHTRLYRDFLKTGRELTPANYREYLFKTVKQCNNFRPTLALQLYNFLDPGKINNILDFSAGWGDRLFAAAISKRKYIGLDPNAGNRPVYQSIIKDLGDPASQRIITTGAEYLDNKDLEINMTAVGIKEFDLIFTSPPYYDYEIYNTEAQSITNYLTTGDKANADMFANWLTYFLFYVIMKYVPYLRAGGYVGIYIQDADNKTYLEPLALFVLANSDILGLTVAGIISATRYPMIIFQKKVSPASIFPFINNDNPGGKPKQFNKPDILRLYQSSYPAIYKLNARLRHIYNNKLMVPIVIGKKYSPADIVSAAIFKFIMNLEPKYTVVLVYGSKQDLGPELIMLANVCKSLDLTLKYVVNKFEAGGLSGSYRDDNMVKYIDWPDNALYTKLKAAKCNIIEVVIKDNIMREQSSALAKYVQETYSSSTTYITMLASLLTTIEPIVKETKNEIRVIATNNIN